MNSNYPSGVRKAKRSVREFFKMFRKGDSRTEWEARWSQDHFSPRWKTDYVPREIKEAVESGWFSQTAPFVDIGCGDGELAAWLASQEYSQVLGVDFAVAAIERAKSQHLSNGKSENLSYEVVDICNRALELGKFGSVVDRGCFHSIPKPLHKIYARNVADICAQGGHFLMYARNGKMTEVDRINEIEQALSPFFEITNTEHVSLVEEPSTHEAIPGVAVWMVRRQ